MKKLIILISFAIGALAFGVTCPIHTYASCYNTGQVGPLGTGHKYHCTCGDDVWVK